LYPDKNTPINAIDVAKQIQVPFGTLEEWKNYYISPKKDRVCNKLVMDRLFLSCSIRLQIFNVISLEVSDTPMMKLLSSPTVFQKIDWLRHWPKELRGPVPNQPQVANYPKVYIPHRSALSPLFDLFVCIVSLGDNVLSDEYCLFVYRFPH
jgi:hypothetical protein